MTLLYESENDFCDRHPKLCTSEVPGLDLTEHLYQPTEDELDAFYQDMERELCSEGKLDEQYCNENYRYQCSDEVIGCELGFCEV